ncbi:iron transporter [Isosphaeraceae bacterium EP7]
MSQRWVGPLLASLIVFGVAGLLYLNVETTRPAAEGPTRENAPSALVAGPDATGDASRPKLQEYPIGEDVEKNHIRFAAVWLRSIMMDGMASSAPGLIHVEADVRALANNPNGFALNEFVPYLKVRYTLADAKKAVISQGEMIPMVAIDGLHYGASMELPPPGSYKLTYHIEPPSAGGLGRHSDPASGVAKWWEPFDAVYDWDVEPEPATAAATPAKPSA